MKKIMLILFVSGIVSQSIAGTLINRGSNESIIFTLKENDTVSMESRAAGFSSQDIPLERIKKTDIRYKTSLTVVSDLIWNDDPGMIAVMYIFFPILPVGAHAADILALPVRGINRLVRNTKNKNDFKALGKVIATNETVEVSNSRFDRIVNIIGK